ncbi:hypothetical protein Tco_1101114, partial [Tanacetum coccineum]
IKKSSSYQFQLENQKFKIGVELFWEIIRISPRVPNKEFVAPPPIDALVTLLKQLGYKGSLNLISDRFTKVIIIYILSKEKSIPKRHNSLINTLKDDGILRKLKFVSKGEDEQNIKLQKKGRGRGKGLIGKKAIVTPSKKGSITDEYNIILDPNVALKLGESISLTEAEEQEEQRRVHENHERIVTEKSTSNEESNEEEAAQLASDMQNATKSNKQEYRIQQQSTGSSEGAGITQEVPDEPKGSSAAKSVEDD